MSVTDTQSEELKISAEAIASAKSKHGEVHYLEIGDEAVLIRKPSKAEFDRFNQSIYEEESRPSALTQLARDCVVIPSKADFNVMLERLPGAAMAIGNYVLGKLAGTKVNDAKKF